MSTYQFEEVVVPRGSYLGWGNYPGQFVTGKVLDYDPHGGVDFNDNPCPQMTVELVEPAASFNKNNERTDFPIGELINLTCGQVSLKRGIKAADPSPGDVVKITLTGTEKTSNGTVKVFGIQIARGAAPEVRRQPQPAQQFMQAPTPANPFTAHAQAAAPQHPAANPFTSQAAPAVQAPQQANPFAQQQPTQPPF